MDTTELRLNTGNETTTVDITAEVAEFCRDKGSGLVSIFLLHATAGVAIFETGAGAERDVLAAIDDLLPADEGKWRHQHGAPGHGRDHVLPAFVSTSLTVPVEAGQMQLSFSARGSMWSGANADGC